MDTAIKFENVGKLYRLGTVGTGTLSHDLRRWWITSVRGKEDPYLKIGETNDRSTKGSSDYVYALKDISFEVKQGDVLGIIGKNGAGKSTLLKLLSRVTYPTTGKIYTKGRIASLLEVGTGFHPELTGRENIYMNGTILGMKKWEIDKQLDEIIDFSGCERYLDTPVKRYSSGMTVRLGFAIAAHLNPEILVVDEVLAVGDAEFQKKAIGKMQDVSKGEGRTVLFVSHNMASVRNLCHSGLVLKNGLADYYGPIEPAINRYLNSDNVNNSLTITDRIGYCKPYLHVDHILINNRQDPECVINSNHKELNISIVGTLEEEEKKIDMIVIFKNLNDTPLACSSHSVYNGDVRRITKGHFALEYTIEIPKFVGKGDVKIDIRLYEPRIENLLVANSCAILHFEGNMNDFCRPIDINKEGFMGLSCSYNVKNCKQ